jgi:hypothetical protein
LKNHPKHIPFYKLDRCVLYIKEELYEIIRSGKRKGYYINGIGIEPRLNGTCTYISRREAAKCLHMSVGHLSHHPRHIPFYKIGGRVFYIKEELNKMFHFGYHTLRRRKDMA